MKTFWSKRIRDMVPYVPGEQPKGQTFVKLNTNENPYPPSPAVVNAMQTSVDDALRLYPDPQCSQLREAIAQYHGLTADMVFPGNGSDEILAFCFQAFFDDQKPLRFSDITYSFYPVYANFFSIPHEEIPLLADFSLDIPAYCQGDSGGIAIANPNAPTGLSPALDDLRRVLDANPHCVVLVDEAYVDFGGTTVVPLIQDYPNLIVVRTLSKSRSLAGLRLGYALGQPDLIAALCCVRDSINSYTVDRLAQVGGTAAMEDVAYFEEKRQQIMDTRAVTSQRLEALGFQVLPSSANFLFVRHPQHSGKELLDGLRAKGILVRWFNLPRIDNHLRISVGTDGEMEALCQAMTQLVSETD